MRSYAKTWPDRVWAVEGANGAGRPLAQRLLEAGPDEQDIKDGQDHRHRILRRGPGDRPDRFDEQGKEQARPAGHDQRTGEGKGELGVEHGLRLQS